MPTSDGGARMKRTIISFHWDDTGDPVADLDCSHGQHVRHRPPFINRPWVLSEAGRADMLGTELDCLRCERMEWPDSIVAYRRTPEFDECTLPAGLARQHSTTRGVWGRIHVVAGTLLYTVSAPINRSFRLEAPASGIVVPEVQHCVAAEGPVRFFVEFARRP